MHILRSAIITGICLLLLCGCSARELEDRTFPEAMELELRDDTLVGGFGEYLVSGGSVAEICRNYQDHLSEYLDLGHVKAIVLGKNLLDDQQRSEALLLELEQMPLISRNSLVFTYDYQGKESYLKKLADSGKSAGQYLLDAYRNNPYRSDDTAVTLAELLGREGS